MKPPFLPLYLEGSIHSLATNAGPMPSLDFDGITRLLIYSLLELYFRSLRILDLTRQLTSTIHPFRQRLLSKVS